VAARVGLLERRESKALGSVVVMCGEVGERMHVCGGSSGEGGVGAGQDEHGVG
jgi:hypothetical protein